MKIVTILSCDVSWVTHVVFYISITTDFIADAMAFEFLEECFVILFEEVGEYVETTTVSHAHNEFFGT